MPFSMRLRLYHHSDGARIAYRELGTGPPLVLLHSGLLSHREWEPIVEPLSARFRVVLPDLPLHGDSEDRPRHPYTREWLAEVVAGFSPTCSARARCSSRTISAPSSLLTAIDAGSLEPSRLVLLPNRLHRQAQPAGRRTAFRTVCRTAAVPGMDRLLSHAARLVFSPRSARASRRRQPGRA